MLDIKEIAKTCKTLRLLYVEDSEISRVSTLEMLENFFTNITVSVNGLDAYEEFKKHNFDIILTDINMPKLNGIDLLKKIRESDDETPVLFISAYNEVSYLLEAIKLGVDGYIIKPVELEPFIATLKKIAYRIELKRENDIYKKQLEIQIAQRTNELERKLHFDALTGLHNRYTFFEDVQKLENPPTIIIIDIDKFKIINEIYGVSNGSIVLQEFATFLLNFTCQSDYKCYRLSGDEFILKDERPNIKKEKYIKDANRLINLLKDFSIELKNDSISIEVTMGISIANRDAFECANIALDYAKQNKNPYVFYSSEIDKRDEVIDTLAWKNITKQAIEHNRVIPVYQPIVDKNGSTVKHETLVRLRESDSQKLITPFFFLEVAKKTGLYQVLSSRVIFDALHLLDTSSHTLSFNFTYDDIKNSSFLNELEIFFKLSKGLGKRAVFEITESQAIENYDDVKQFIKRFRNYGVKFAIDDFGSGFSNFEYILEIEPDYLKIDGSLIKNIDTDKKAHVLVKAIVKFSHKLGIKVIAEYVHSQKIFEMLKAIDVDEYQGYYFSEPLETQKIKEESK